MKGRKEKKLALLDSFALQKGLDRHLHLYSRSPPVFIFTGGRLHLTDANRDLLGVA
jgi:hypothetical protein